MQQVIGAYGATVARLTPDQKVGRLNRSGLISFSEPVLIVALVQLFPPHRPLLIAPT